MLPVEFPGIERMLASIDAAIALRVLCAPVRDPQLRLPGELAAGVGSQGSLITSQECHAMVEPSAGTDAISLPIYPRPLDARATFTPLGEGWHGYDDCDLAFNETS